MSVNTMNLILPAVLALLGAGLLLFAPQRLPPRFKSLSPFIFPGAFLLVLITLLMMIPIALAQSWRQTLDLGMGIRLPTQIDGNRWLMAFGVTLPGVFLASRAERTWKPGAGMHLKAFLLVLLAGNLVILVSGSTVSLAFSLFLWDMASAALWMRFRHRDAAVMRLGIGAFSTACLLSLSFVDAPAEWLSWTIWIIGLARIVIFPFFEVRSSADFPSIVRLYWFLLSLTPAVVFLGAVTQFSPHTYIVMIIILCLNGVCAWLSKDHDENLLRLLITLAALLFCFDLSVKSEGAWLLVSLELAITILWLFPSQKTHYDSTWKTILLYLAGGLASVSLFALPGSGLWAASVQLAVAFFADGRLPTAALLAFAIGLALAKQVEFWIHHLRQPSLSSEKDRVFLLPVMALPFLVPFGGGAIVAWMNNSSPIFWQDIPLISYVALCLPWLWAAFLGFGRPVIFALLRITPEGLAEAASLNWLLAWIENGVSVSGRWLLRFRAIIEGRHYMAWAFLASILVIVLFLLD
jgi:hypothetical protein